MATGSPIIREDTSASSSGAVRFFDLPREIRDFIYAQFPYLASIHINQDPTKGLLQPNISKVCRRMRNESLDIFYSRNKFFLDLRGWKGASYPRKWTPLDIFERWITAIGDTNAKSIRSVSFFSHNFSANIKVSPEKPPTLSLRFRTNTTNAELAEGVPVTYSFDIAARRAETSLRFLLEDLQQQLRDRSLNVGDIKMLCSAVNGVQPFLCRRMNLGYLGAVLLNDRPTLQEWPRTHAHLNKCDDCGYHRFTREQDEHVPAQFAPRCS